MIRITSTRQALSYHLVVRSRAANSVVTCLFSPFRACDTLQSVTVFAYHELLCLPCHMTVLLHEQVKNTASSDVRELLVLCSKAVNYAKSKSSQALADLEPSTSTAVDSTGEMFPWTPSTTPQIKNDSFTQADSSLIHEI